MNYTSNQSRRIDFFRQVLLAGLGVQLVSVPALLAQDTSATAPSEMKKTVVTGSIIPTAETFGVSPVETISTEDVAKTGSVDVLGAIRALSASFSGNGNVGQTVNNGGFGEAYISIRNLPTLVLLDGKRLNISAFSTYYGSYGVDLNSIPLSMIDRIEILKDGASSIYGSDAVGGVVNLITKKNYNGVEVTGRYGFATGKGTYNEARGSVVLGHSTDDTRLTVGANYYYSDPLYTKDRPIGGLGPAELGAAGLNAPSYFSPSYPGRVGNFLLAGSPLAKNAPGYNPAVTTPPVFPGKTFTSVPDYNTYAQSQLGYSPYLPLSSVPEFGVLGSTLLNTTTLNTVSIQRQDRRNVLGNLEHDFFEDRLTGYAQVMYAETESIGQLAPAPMPSLGLYNLTVPANNPYNPFGIDLGSGAAASPRIRSRFIETGNRTFDAKSEIFHTTDGIKGTIDGKYHYDVSVDYSRTSQYQAQNSANSQLVNLAMTPYGTGGLSALTDSAGNHVPLYNVFAVPGQNSPATIRAIRASGYQGGYSDLLSFDGQLGASVYDLPAGSVELAGGGQFIREKLSTSADDVLAAGNLIGLNAIPVFPGGSRDRYAGYLEAKIPIFSKEHEITGFHAFEINTSGRYETISSGGNEHSSSVPKVGFKWQPFDEQVTLRGSYSQGFVVPQLSQLYGAPLQGNPYLAINGVAQQETINQLSNPNLPPSTSETMTLGIIYSPKEIKNLTMSVDYYHISQPSTVYYGSASAIIADLNKNGSKSIWANRPELGGQPIYLDQNNQAYIPTAGDPTTAITHDNFGLLNSPLLAGGAQKTQGIDFGLNYLLQTDKSGSINFFANANVQMAWEVQLGPGTPYFDYNGQYTDSQAVAAAQGMIPEFNITTGFTWSMGNFDWTVIAHYLPGVVDMGDLHPSVGAPSNDFTANGAAWRIPDYYRLDMQLAYTFKGASKGKWYDGTRVALGVNNLTGELPPLIASSSEDNTDKSTYDYLGRFVYVEVSKKF
jgi:iron complex outermembrane recepter protein